MTEPIPAELARRIKLVILDVDGVLTDGAVHLGQTQSGEVVELKRFDITDGLGVKLLMKAGIHVAIVSGRESAATALRARELGITDCYQDASARKLPLVETLMQRKGATWSEVAYLADDLADLPVLERVGLPAAVANAVAEVRACAVWTTNRQGGHGAVREFAEGLLRARGEWDRLVKEYRDARGS
ncbi:MAG: HAD hydrolase family protein [Gemmatimonadetes bacterium]|nr:HAD hydrolase family protein [Gemmatimonadota bacterium]